MHQMCTCCCSAGHCRVGLQIYNHLTARVHGPNGEDYFLINAFGLSCARLPPFSACMQTQEVFSAVLHASCPVTVKSCAADGETTASSLLTIDLEGNVINPGVVGDIFNINRAGFVIHSALHRGRPDAIAIMHSHFAPATGIAAHKGGLKVQACSPDD